MDVKCGIPVIDLLDFPNQLPKLISACEHWGCFRLINHHQILPVTLMSEMKSVVRPLFDLPVEIKRKNIDIIAGSGYMAPSAKNPLIESFAFYDMANRDDVDNFCSQLEASAYQRETILRYVNAIHELLVGIVEKLVEGLGVKSENIGHENWPFELRINKYHFTPQSVGSPGVQIHTDSSFLTILQDDEDVGGLEVMNKSGEFIPVDPWSGTLLVNLGDMATVWSNGRFCNVKHRVQCKESKVRVSIASFVLGPRDRVEPLKELVDDDHQCVFMPTTYEEYRKIRVSTNLRAGETLELLYIPSCKK